MPDIPLVALPAQVLVREPVDEAPSNLAVVADRLVPLGQAVEDRLLFSRAQGVLAGLMDCTPADAGRALLVVATELGLSPDSIAEGVMELMAAADGGGEPLMLMLAAATAQPADRCVRLKSFGMSTVPRVTRSPWRFSAKANARQR